MLIVETFIDVSPNKGYGLFAKRPIKEGTVYWVRNEIFDKVLTETELKLLPEFASTYFQKYGFQEVSRNWYLCGDHARFTNHSENPNTKNHFNAQGLLQYCTVTKSLNIGDEIVINYTEICLTCKQGVVFVGLS